MVKNLVIKGRYRRYSVNQSDSDKIHIFIIFPLVEGKNKKILVHKN